MFDYIFHFGLPGTFLYVCPKNTPTPAPERCIFHTCLKTCSWKSKMEYGVKYEVYLDILLRVGTLM